MSYLEKQIERDYQSGDVIFRENDSGNSMFILRSGEVEISEIINHQKVVLATLKKGAIFGEMALVDYSPRSATVIAITNVKCLEISRLLFNKRLENIPSWMQSFYQILVERLREANKKQKGLNEGDIAKQVVFLLHFLLSKEEKNKLGKTLIPWQESAESIAFLLNEPIAQVMKVMNKLTLTSLASSEINYEIGRLFYIEDQQLFEKFTEYCKERFLEKLGMDISPEYEEKSVIELQLIKFIGKLMSEQATASDLHIKYFKERCEEDLGKQLDHFKYEIRRLIRKGVLTLRVDQNSEKYYEVNRELLGMKLGMGETLELFKEIESRFG